MRRTIYLILIVLQPTLSGVIQAENNIDSTNYYNKQCQKIYNKPFSSSLKDLVELKKAANWFAKKNGSINEAWCYTLIGRYYYKNNDNNLACNYFFKSIDAYKKINLTDSLATTYDKLASCQYYQANYKAAKTNFSIGLLYPASVKTKASLLNGLAMSYDALSLNDSALLTYNKALDLYRSCGDSLGIAYIYSNIGTMYLQQEEVLPETKDYLTKAYNIIINTDDKFSLAGITSNLSVYYFNNKNYKKALKNYFITLQIDSTLKDKFQIGVDLNNIGICYLNLKDTIRAIKYLSKALQLGAVIGAKEIISYSSYNLGEIELYKSNLKKALQYATTCLKTSKETGNTSGIISALNLLSNIYSVMGEYKTAFNYLQKYNTLHDSVFSIEKTKQLAEISEKYKSTQQQNKILSLEKNQLQSKNIQILLIILIIIITLLLVFIFFSYWLVKKNRNNIKEQQIFFKKLLSNSSEFTFLIDQNKKLKYVSPSYTKMFLGKPEMLLQDTFYKNLDENGIKKSNELLAQLYDGKKRIDFELKVHNIYGKDRFVTGIAQNLLNDRIIKGIIINLWDITDLKETSIALKKREKELESSNQTKEKLFSIISHDLIGNVGTTYELIKLLNDNFDNFDKKERQKIVSSATNTLETTYTLISNLLSWARIQTKKINTNRKLILLNPVLEKVVNLYKNQLYDKSISISIDYDRTIQLSADPNQLEFIFRNLVRNAIKFTPIGGKIRFSCKSYKGIVTITIKDNGIGMSPEKINELLSNKKEIISTAGTNHEQGTGLGLIIVKEFIKSNKGKFQIKSELDKGTEIILTFLTS